MKDLGERVMEPWIEFETPREFVLTAHIQNLVNRAETYLAAGCPIHLRGSAGTGKTTLAMHLASRRGRPVILLHGDEEITTSRLIGGEAGYRIRTVRDNFIRSVYKSEEEASRKWSDDRLTTACRNGFTFLYDEFNRSRPGANNVLLGVLQEGVISLPAGSQSGEHYLRVHPEFRAIFTSNPEEYAGVHPTQDALLGRLVTIDIENFDRQTEVAITYARSGGLDLGTCETIVDVVRAVRAGGDADSHPQGLRTCVTLGRILATARARKSPPVTREVYLDVLASGGSRTGEAAQYGRLRWLVEEVLDRHGLASLPGEVA